MKRYRGNSPELSRRPINWEEITYNHVHVYWTKVSNALELEPIKKLLRLHFRDSWNFQNPSYLTSDTSMIQTIKHYYFFQSYLSQRQLWATKKGENLKCSSILWPIEPLSPNTSWTKGVKEDVQDFFWTPYERSTYVLYPGSIIFFIFCIADVLVTRNLYTLSKQPRSKQ